MKRIILLIVVAMMLLLFQACHPLFYVAKDFSGKVVDADTNMPIEGVVVVAEWVPYHARIAAGGHWDVKEAYETVTDKDGKYTIRGWGPRFLPPFQYYDNRDPSLYLFKKGYRYLAMSNGDIEQMNEYYGKDYLDKLDFDEFYKLTTFESDRTVRTSIWAGRTIKMKKFTGTKKELDSMLGDVWTAVFSKEDLGLPRSKVPLALKEWDEAQKELRSLH